MGKELSGNDVLTTRKNPPSGNVGPAKMFFFFGQAGLSKPIDSHMGRTEGQPRAKPTGVLHREERIKALPSQEMPRRAFLWC